MLFSSLCCCWSRCLSYCACHKEIYLHHFVFYGWYLSLWQWPNVWENNMGSNSKSYSAFHSFSNDTQTWIMTHCTYSLTSLHFPPCPLFQPINPRSITRNRCHRTSKELRANHSVRQLMQTQLGSLVKLAQINATCLSRPVQMRSARTARRL